MYNVVPEPLGGGSMEVYQIEPDAEAHWVVVSEFTNTYGTEAKQSFYVRRGEDFVETRDPEALVFLREQVKARSTRARGRAA